MSTTTRLSYVAQSLAIGILLTVTSGKSSQPTIAAQQPPIASIVESIQAWPSASRAYSEESWRQIVSSALVLQKWNHGAVQSALETYQKSYSNDPEAAVTNDGKLYLLMRVMFELPQKATPQEARLWNWVTHRTQYNADGTVNAGWPIRWVQGRPELISGYEGRQGFSAYNAAAEFADFYRNYPYRRLTELDTTRYAPISPENRLGSQVKLPKSDWRVSWFLLHEDSSA